MPGGRHGREEADGERTGAVAWRALDGGGGAAGAGHPKRERRDGDADAKGADEIPQEVPRPKPERRAKKERRRRIDPTTFEKQYTVDELEFMNAMQRFKVQTCKAFPSHGDVLQVALSLGYRKSVWEDDSIEDDAFESEATSND